jgi:hypothetical protein
MSDHGSKKKIRGTISKQEINEKGIQETGAAHIFAYDTVNRQVVGTYEFPSDEAASRREFHMEIHPSVDLSRVQFIWGCRNNKFFAQIHPTVT